MLLVISTALTMNCTGFTEYDMAFTAGLQIISSDDFSTITTITGISGARSLLLYPGNIFVASTDGVVYRFDSESFNQTGKYLVDSPSPAGFSQMVYSTLNNSAYLTGSPGKILEINLPDCTVLDQFSVCQSPVKLALGHESQYLFVADGPSNRIYQVGIDNNAPSDNVSIYFAINCMEPCQNPDSMLVGTSYGVNLVEVLSPSLLRNIQFKIETPFTAIAAVPDDTVFVGVTVSFVCLLDPFIPAELPPPPSFHGVVNIEGDSHLIAMGTDGQHAYVLSYLGDSISRLVAYNYFTYEIDQQVDIPGYPLDLEVFNDGIIYVLTYE